MMCVNVRIVFLFLTVLNATQVRCVAFSLDGNLLAAGSGVGHVYIYRLTNGKWEQVSCTKYHSRQVCDTIRTILLLTAIRSLRSASVPLAVCYWSQVMTRLLPSGRFHPMPRGRPLLT